MLLDAISKRYIAKSSEILGFIGFYNHFSASKRFILFKRSFFCQILQKNKKIKIFRIKKSKNYFSNEIYKKYRRNLKKF